MDIVIRSEDCTEVWDGVLYKKLSDYPRISRWELKTLAEFATYEKSQGRGCTLHCGDEALKAAILDAMAHPEVYRDTPRPALITECTACPVRKGCETAFVCHTTSPENARAILRCGRLLSAVRARGIPAEELARESRNAANDPADYFDYVMFTWGNCQGGDRLVTERRLGRFPDETDLSSGFEPGVRFYFRYEDLKKTPRCYLRRRAAHEGAGCGEPFRVCLRHRHSGETAQGNGRMHSCGALRQGHLCEKRLRRYQGVVGKGIQYH